MDGEQRQDARQASRYGGETRGRDARTPLHIPRRGWRDILLRMKRKVGHDRISLVAASVAFYLFLSIFPGLAAAISVYGLVSDPVEVQQQVEGFSAVPTQVRDIIAQQLERLAEQSSGALGWTLVGSVVIALWSASRGMRALMQALSIAYGEEEKRGFIRQVLVGLTFTGGAIAFVVLAVVVIIGVPAFFGSFGLGVPARWAGAVAAWGILLGAFIAGLSAVYRWGPSRTEARWRWLTPGAVVAALLWIAGSALFSLYVARFGSYGEMYGSLGGVAVLLLWLWLSSFAVLIGAELDAEMEHQTARDSTTGEPGPRGRRGAYVADHVGRTP